MTTVVKSIDFQLYPRAEDNINFVKRRVLTKSKSRINLVWPLHCSPRAWLALLQKCKLVTNHGTWRTYEYCTLSGRGPHNPPKYTLLTQPPEPRPLKFCRNFFLSIALKVTCDQAVLLEVAWVAGVRKGRGRELGRKTVARGRRE